MWPQTLPTLETDRLILRTPNADDTNDLFAIYGDPEVMQYTDEKPFPSKATVAQMLGSVQRLFQAHESLEWAIVHKSTGQVIGTCGLHSFDRRLNKAEVGCLLRQDHWAQGYMPEALLAVIQYANQQLGVRTLEADVDPENYRALLLFKRLGFVVGDGGRLVLTLG